jgi:hypothetical protein
MAEDVYGCFHAITLLGTLGMVTINRNIPIFCCTMQGSKILVLSTDGKAVNCVCLAFELLG